MRPNLSANHFLSEEIVANLSLEIFPAQAFLLYLFLHLFHAGEVVLPANLIEPFNQIAIHADAHVFRALDEKSLVDQIAQQILLLLFVQLLHLVLSTSLAVVTDFIMQRLIRLLHVRKRDRVVVHTRDDFFDDSSLRLGAHIQGHG